MLGMLVEPSTGEYPTDYLLSRLRARAAAPAGTGDAAAPPDDRSGVSDRRIWGRLQAERRWLFNQLNRDLRCALAPLFVYFEISTVAQVLRFLAAGHADAAGPVLGGSLLGAELKAILRSRDSVGGVLVGLERFFKRHGAEIKGLEKSFREKDLGRSEELLRGGILAAGLQRSGHKTMVSLLADLVDIRNLRVLARRLRWKTAAVPPLLAGGRLNIRLFDDQFEAADLLRMIGHWTGGAEPNPEMLQPTRLEGFLQTHLVLKTARLRRLGDPVAACIEYIFLQAALTRQQSVRFHGGSALDAAVGAGEG